MERPGPGPAWARCWIDHAASAAAASASRPEAPALRAPRGAEQQPGQPDVEDHPAGETPVPRSSSSRRRPRPPSRPRAASPSTATSGSATAQGGPFGWRVSDRHAQHRPADRRRRRAGRPAAPATPAPRSQTAHPEDHRARREVGRGSAAGRRSRRAASDESPPAARSHQAILGSASGVRPGVARRRRPAIVRSARSRTSSVVPLGASAAAQHVLEQPAATARRHGTAYRTWTDAALAFGHHIEVMGRGVERLHGDEEAHRLHRPRRPATRPRSRSIPPRRAVPGATSAAAGAIGTVTPLARARRSCSRSLRLVVQRRRPAAPAAASTGGRARDSGSRQRRRGARRRRTPRGGSCARAAAANRQAAAPGRPVGGDERSSDCDRRAAGWCVAIGERGAGPVRAGGVVPPGSGPTRGSETDTASAPKRSSAPT